MHYTSLLTKHSRSIAGTIVILFVGQIVTIHSADAKSTSLAFQRDGQIKRTKISPFFRPETEMPEDPPILNAVRRNDLQVIKKLIASGAELDIANDQQFTPLNVAVLLGNEKIVRELISAGADVNFPDEPITVPFKPPMQTRNMKTGAESLYVTEKPEWRKTITLHPTSPLFCAIDKSNEHLAILLIENGASFNSSETKGEGTDYPLQRILSKSLFKAADSMLARATAEQRQQLLESLVIWSGELVNDKKIIDIMSYLAGKGTSFEIYDEKGMTPLITAVIEGNLQVVKFLLEKGADVDTPAKATKRSTQYAGYTPLSMAMMTKKFNSRREKNRPAIIRLLILRGADLNHKSEDENSATLFLPVTEDGLELIELFHEHGADLDQENRWGETLLKQALDETSFEVSTFLLSKGADINSPCINLNAYMHKNDNATIDFLLANNFDLNKQKKDTFSGKAPLPLIYACEKGRADYVEKLIAHGADVNPVSPQGAIPLFSAIKSGSLEIVKILLDNGADINYQTINGMNAFMLASTSGRKDIADYLKSWNADSSVWISDVKILAPLKQAGLIPEEIEGIPKKQLEYFKLMLQHEFWITTFDDLNNPDPRFSSPEKTWALYKKALIDGELEMAAKCHLRKNDHYIEMYKAMGAEKTSEAARNFRHIEKITGDEQRSKYRIKRNINDKDITFYVYFTNVFGEWKIARF